MKPFKNNKSKVMLNRISTIIIIFKRKTKLIRITRIHLFLNKKDFIKFNKVLIFIKDLI